jgi:hypothetical protein
MAGNNMSEAAHSNMESEQSLVALAERHALPRFQYMDETTFRWILQNNPGYEISNLPNIQSGLLWLSMLTLPTEWFLESRIVDSLHGSRHLLRTAYFIFVLTGELPNGGLDQKHAAIAALIHDIRRRNDKGDSGHAERSARWFRAHSAEVGQHFGVDLKPVDVAGIEAAVALHETPYVNFTSQQKELYYDHKILVDLLKTADALDRYRLPKLKWWINDEFCQLNPRMP